MQNPHYDEVFQVVETHGDGRSATTYTLSDLRGNRDGLGFTQPVAADRVTAVDLLPMIPPTKVHTSIVLREAGEDKTGTIVNPSIDGKVRIRFENGQEKIYDLSKTQYRWL